MRGKRIGLILGVLILAMFSLAFIEAAGEKCQIITRSQCSSSGGYVVMGISGTTNAHGEIYSSSIYSNVLCCNFGDGVQSNECSGGVSLLKLSSATNAHAGTSGYSNQVCYKGSPGFSSFSCQTITSGNCPSGYNSILSLSSSTNAHIGGPNDYSTKICCNVEYGTVTPPTTQPSVYWHNSYAGYFGEPMNEISISLGNSVYLIGKDLTDYKSQSVTIEIYEDDGIWGDDLIRTISSTIDYNGVLATTYWAVTEADLQTTGEYSSPTSYSFDEFYFVIKKQGTVIATSNDLTLTLIPPETIPEEGVCTGTATPCSSFTTQSPCQSQMGCSWVVVFAGYPPQGFCQVTPSLSEVIPCSSIANQTSCQTQQGCTWGSTTPVCGNHIIESPETCDDGNTVSGDGCSSICQTESAQTTAYWSDDPTGLQVNYITTEIGGNVFMLGKNLGVSNGQTVNFSIYERDFGGWPDYNDLIRTKTATVSGGSASISWTVTQDDLDKTGESQDGGPDTFEEFYFEVRNQQTGILIVTSNDLHLTISREQIEEPAGGTCTGTATSCSSFTTQSPCQSQMGCSWVVVFAGYPPQGYCQVTPSLSEVIPCSSITNQTSCQTQQGCTWTEGPPIEPPLECLSIGFCSDYDDQTSCDTDTCSIADESIMQVDCSDPNIDCSCWWDDETSICGNSWTFLNGTAGNETCLITQNGADDCGDGWLSFNWTGTWVGDPLSEQKATCEAGGADTIPCPALLQLPFFSTYNIIAIIILAALIYLIISSRKKSGSKKRKR